jgi:hypothetical protein
MLQLASSSSPSYVAVRHNVAAVRLTIAFVFTIWLSLATAAHADDSSDPNAPPPADPVAPSGPLLQPSDTAPVICDPGSRSFRFVEVRGTGFNAWASQRLVGNLVDGSGTPRIQWGSVWVSPQGRLTLEVNLCADPFRGRAALPVGTYTVAVGPGSGAAIAATSIQLSPPPEPPAEGDQLPEIMPPTAPPDTANPGVPQPVVVLPSLPVLPTPTPLPALAMPVFAPTPTPAPRTGPGSQQQPFPLGAPGTLADGWQLVVTGVTPDAWSGIHSEIASSVAPAPDQRDFMVRVQATFVGQGTGVFSAMRLALLSGVQTTYDQLRNNCGVVPDMVPPNLVTAGGSLRGNLCFTVRASDIDSLVLFDNQSSLAQDKLYFSLR